MTKGRIVALDVVEGREFAALLDDGNLHDVFIDTVDNHTPQPEAIYHARAGLPMKGQNGIILDLGGKLKAYLRSARGVSPGASLLVQISRHSEAHKAPPASTRLMFKSRYAILTPHAPGYNIGRKIRDEETRNSLLEIVNDAMYGADDSIGVVLRSACEAATRQEVFDDVCEMRAQFETVLAPESSTKPGLIFDAPSAHLRAWRDWGNPTPDLVEDAAGCFETLGIWDHLTGLQNPNVSLAGGASMMIEPTAALVAVDVNTGGDFSHAAGLNANLASARELPRQLRLRGFGGQIVIDFAPMAKSQRRLVEQALRRALKTDPVETSLIGWTPLGHFELLRKRERAPLNSLSPF